MGPPHIYAHAYQNRWGQVVVVVAAAIDEVFEAGATCGSPGHHGIEPGDGRWSTDSLLHHGCMIPLLTIKLSARGAPCSNF